MGTTQTYIRSRGRFIATGAAALASINVVASARAAQFTWKCGSEPVASLPLNVRLVEAFNKIKAATNGQLDITLYPNSSLGSGPSMISQLQLGALECLCEAGGQFDTVVPIAAMENVPFAFPNYETAWRAFDGDLGNAIRNEFAAKGYLIVGKVWDSGFRVFTTSPKPIRVVDDLDGMKMRVPPSKFRVDAFKSLGASPTPVAYAEVYTALKTHVVDGQEGPLVFVDAQKFFEVQKYCSVSNHMWGAFWVFFNKDKWASLPANYQDLVRKTLDATALVQRQDDKRLDLTERQEADGNLGMQFNDVNGATFRARLKSSGFYARWRTEWGTTAWNALEKYSGPLA